MTKSRTLSPVPHFPEAELPRAKQDLLAALETPGCRYPAPSGVPYVVISMELMTCTYLSEAAKTALMRCLSVPNNWRFGNPAMNFNMWFGWGQDKSYKVLNELAAAGHAHHVRVDCDPRSAGYEFIWKFTERSSGLPPEPSPKKKDKKYKTWCLRGRHFSVHGAMAMPMSLKALNTGSKLPYPQSSFTGVPSASNFFGLPWTVTRKNRDINNVLRTTEGSDSTEYSFIRSEEKEKNPISLSYEGELVSHSRNIRHDSPGSPEVDRPQAVKPEDQQQEPDRQKPRPKRTKGRRAPRRKAKKAKVNHVKRIGPVKRLKARTGHGHGGYDTISTVGFTANPRTLAKLRQDPALAVKALRKFDNMPRTGSIEWYRFLRANPLMALLQEIIGTDAWDSTTTRRHAQWFKRGKHRVAELLALWGLSNRVADEDQLPGELQEEAIGILKKARRTLSNPNFSRRPVCSAYKEETDDATLLTLHFEWNEDIDRARKILGYRVKDKLEDISDKVRKTLKPSEDEASPGKTLYQNFFDDQRRVSSSERRRLRAFSTLWLSSETNREWLYRLAQTQPDVAWWVVAQLNQSLPNRPVYRQWLDQTFGQWLTPEVARGVFARVFDGLEPFPGVSATDFVVASLTHNPKWPGHLVGYALLIRYWTAGIKVSSLWSAVFSASSTARFREHKIHVSKHSSWQEKLMVEGVVKSLEIYRHACKEGPKQYRRALRVA
jgi:hypothetical protein